MAPKLKVTYLPIPGRAGAIRAILNAGAIDFEDEIIQFPDMATMKEKVSPMGHLPVLTIDDKVVLTESNAIARYCAKLAGFVAPDPVAEAQVDMYMCICEDMVGLVVATMQIKDEDEKKAKRLALIDAKEGRMTDKLGKFDKIVAGKKFCVADTLTAADFAIHQLMTFGLSGAIDHIPTDFFKNHSGLMAIYQTVQDHEKTKPYFDKLAAAKGA